MKPRPFTLERYFARYEFAARYLLCASDPESMSVGDLLAFEPGAEEGLHDLLLGYTESRGNPALRGAIATLYAHADAEQILVHSGAQEPIFTFMNLVLAAGDHAIVQFPAYQSHYSIAEAIGAEVTRWNADFAREGAPDPDELARAIRPSTRAIILTTPNNPTGYAFDRERLNAVVAIARKHGLWLFADEVYRGSERDGGPAPAVCDLYERGVSLGAMAKTYGLAGLRIGWISTQDTSLYERMAQYKDYLTICNNAPGEYLATLALRHGATLIERVRRIATSNLDHLDGFFARRTDLFEWTRPRAGTTAFPRYLAGSSDAFCARLVERAGVLLLPSTAFDAADDRVRVGYGRTNLPEAVAALDQFLEEDDS
jgi:aspartate/methionine/tyrosine aminotransferase